VISGPSLATLGLKIENGEVVKATTSLDALTVAGAKAEASAQRLTRRMALQEIQAREMDAVFGSAAGRVSTLTASMEQSGAAAGVHGLQLGRLNMELGTAIGRFTGLNTAATRLAGQLGGAVTGYGPMIAVLGGITVVTEAWHAWHEEAAKAKEEQDKLTSSLLTWYQTSKQGVAGTLPKEIDAMKTKVKELHKEMDDLMAGKFFAGVEAVGAGGSKASAWMRIFTAGDFTAITNQIGIEVAKGTAHVAKEITDGGNAVVAASKEVAKKLEDAAREARAKAVSQSADLLGEGLAGPGAIQRMQAQADAYRKMAAAFAASGDVAHALEYAKASDTLTAAIEKETAAERALFVEVQANLAKTNDRIAQLRIEVDADVRMAAAKRAGQGAVDALTVAMAEEAAARELIGRAMPRQIEQVVALTRAHVENEIAARKDAEAEKQLAADIQQAAKDIVDQIKATQDAAEKQRRYVEDMRKTWLGFVESVTTGGLKSFQSFFDNVYHLFVRMLENMQRAGKGSELGAKLLGLGAAGLGGASTGYAIGQQSGSAAAGALGGALGGAAAGFAVAGPVGAAVGAVGGLVGGIIGAGRAAKEAAQHMAELRKALDESIASIKADLAGDALGSAVAQVHAQFDALRKQNEDARAGGSAGSSRVAERTALERQLNDLEAQKIAQLQQEAALQRQQLAEDLRVEILRNNGNADAADALTLQLARERQLADLRKQGIDEALLAQLAASQAAKDAADAKAKADAAALEAANQIKAAAEAAAAAAEKAAQQQRALEDLNVELLRAKGQGGAADDLAFQLEQQRRLDDAQKNQSQDYVDKLKELQQLQRDQRAAQQLIDSTGGGSAGAAARGASQALTAVSAVVTDRSALMLVDINRSQLTTLGEIRDIIKRTGGVGGGGGGVVINNRFEFTAKLTDEEYRDIVAKIEGDIDEVFANKRVGATRYAGSVGR
jgi:hypothetical protein